MKVLIADSSLADYDRITASLKIMMTRKPVHCSSIEEFGQAIAGERFDVVLADYTLGKSRVIELIALVSRKYTNVPFIVVSSDLRDSEVVSLLESGVTDYVSKNNLGRLTIAVNRAVRECYTKAELARSEEKFKAISNYTANWETWIDTNGKPTWMNPGVINLIGYTAEEMLAWPDFYETMVYKDDLPGVRAKLSESLSHRSGGDHFEFRGNHANGSHPWFSISWKQVYDETGHWLGIRTSALDITQKKLQEQELLEREHLLQEMQKMARVGSWTWNTLTDEVTISSQMMDIFQLTSPNACQSLRDVYSFIHPDSMPRASKVLQKVRSQFVAKEFEVKILDALQVEKHLLIRVSPRSVTLGESHIMYGTALDITELKQSHEQQAKSEFRFRRIFESIKDVYYQAKPDGTITMISPSVHQLLGYKPEEILGRQVSGFYADPAIRNINVAALQQEGDAVEFEAALFGKDGAEVIVSVNLSRLMMEGEWVIQGLLRNITEKKKQEIRLELKRLKLMEAHTLNQQIIETSDRFFYAAAVSKDDEATRSLKYISPQILTIAGITEDEVREKQGWSSAIHAEDEEDFGAAMNSLFTYKQPVEVTYRVFNPALKKYVWVEDYACPVVDAKGNVNEIYGSVKDITERKMAEEKIANEKKQSLAYQFQLLSSQLNPNFIYNTLNSFQYYILNGFVEESLNHISDFSLLLRRVLENSMYQFITLEDEIGFLKQYVQISGQRMKKKLNFKISVQPEMEVSEFYIPPMMLQPYIENAILHGLADSPHDPELTVSFSKVADRVFCTIEDNGVGRAVSKKHRGIREKFAQPSFAMGINQKRINLLNQVTNNNFKVEVLDLFDDAGNAAGTRVVLNYTEVQLSHEPGDF